MGYERFTDRARIAFQYANQEAQRLNHEYIGTEHILLGLLREGGGVAAKVLESIGADLGKIRREVENLVQSGPTMIIMGKLPFTPRAKQVIEFAQEEAANLNHNYVGTEHVLLGLLRVSDGGQAEHALAKLSIGLEQVRAAVLAMSCVKESTLDAEAMHESKVVRIRNLKIGERIEILANLQYPGFSDASKHAKNMALARFGVDESGHFHNVDIERSQASIHVKFVGYEAIGGMGGWQHVYTFEAWVESE